MAHRSIVGAEDVGIDEILTTEKEAWGDLAAERNTLEERIETHPEGFVGVELEDELVGYAFGIRYDHDSVDPRTWTEAVDLENHDPESGDLYVVTVGVAEDHRGEGHGSTVMQGLEERAREIGVDDIYLGRRDTEANESFYKSLGYEDKERIPGWWAEDESSEGYGVMMKKNLV